MTDEAFDALRREKLAKDTTSLGIELTPHENEDDLLILKMASFNLQRIERESEQTTARHQSIDGSARNFLKKCRAVQDGCSKASIGWSELSTSFSALAHHEEANLHVLSDVSDASVALLVKYLEEMTENESGHYFGIESVCDRLVSEKFSFHYTQVLTSSSIYLLYYTSSSIYPLYIVIYMSVVNIVIYVRFINRHIYPL
jgi:hypothetical protein